MRQSIETEVKIAVRSAASVRKKLRETGFRISRRRAFEQNAALDDSGGRLRASGLLLRVRQSGGRVICTYKGRSAGGPFKRREEREFTASDFGECMALFGGIGLQPTFRYEKYRTEFSRPGDAGHVTLDETPIGWFLELEGPPRWIDATAASLGHSRADYITASYWSLFTAHCKAFGVTRRDMTFGPGGR